MNTIFSLICLQCISKSYDRMKIRRGEIEEGGVWCPKKSACNVSHQNVFAQCPDIFDGRWILVY